MKSFFTWASGLKFKNKGERFFTAPHAVLEIPCGCSRTKEDKPFDLQKVKKGFIHRSTNCNGHPFQIEETTSVVLPRRETMRQHSSLAGR